MSIATHSTRNCQADRNSVLTGSGTALFMLGVLLGLALLACGNDGSLFGSSNHAPRADAGQDQQVNVGASVILDGDGSDDPDGDPIQYAWAFITGPVWVSVDSAGMPRAHVRLPVDGTFEFRLTVVDERGARSRARPGRAQVKAAILEAECVAVRCHCQIIPRGHMGRCAP